LNILKEKLIKAGFANEKGFPKYVGNFLFLSDTELIRRYKSILRGFLNFYNLAENRSRLNEMVYILEYSLAHSLAAKHRLSLKEVFNRYGKPVTVKIEKGGHKEVVTLIKHFRVRTEYLDKKYAKPKIGKAKTNIPFQPLSAIRD
jgi:hypothetical protein